MEILGIGMSELIFIVIIALIVLGPKDMQKAGRTIGKWLRSIVTSDGWKVFQQTSRELRTLPNRLMREANEELGKVGDDLNNAIAPARERHGSLDTPPDSRQTAPPSPLPITPSSQEQIAPPPSDEAGATTKDQETNA
jgi:sec-independent protein translocase protein TatB